MSIELKIPNAPVSPSVRHVRYISPATKSVLFIITGANQLFVNVTPNSPGCSSTSDGTVCRFDNVGAPLGKTSIKVIAYDAPVPPPGSKVGNALSSGSTDANIVEGQANVVNISLGGVPAKAQITSLNTTPLNGSATDLHFTLKVMDAAGYTIVGSTPYGDSNGDPSPLGVGISETTPSGYAPAFQFVVNGTKSSNNMDLTSPSDAYSVIYPGNGVISATLGVQQNGSPLLTTATITPRAATAPLQDIPQLESGAVLLSLGNGAFWFTEPSKKAIGYVTGGVEHDILLPSGHTPTQLAIGPDYSYGQTFVFGTAQGTVGYLTADGVRGEYALPDASAVGGVAAPFNPQHDEIFYTQPALHKIGRLPIFGGTATECTLPSTAAPGAMQSGYFVDPGSNAIGYVDDTGWKENPLPTGGSDPTGIAIAPGNVLWVAEGGGKRLAHIDPQSGVAAEFPTDAPLTSVATVDEAAVIAATDTNGNVEYFLPDGTRVTTPTGSAGPATQIEGYSDQAFVYVCSTCAVNLQQFLF